MIKIHLSRILGERRLKISDVERATGIGRGVINRLFQETAEKVDLAVLDQLCTFLSIQIADLIEHIPDAAVKDGKAIKLGSGNGIASAGQKKV